MTGEAALTQTRSLQLQFIWWLLLVLLGPLLWVQGRWARWRTPRLPPLAPPLAGVIAGAGGGHGRLLQLQVLGESPAAGVGVSTVDESLPARFANELARRHGCNVAWRSFAENGADVQRVIDLQLPQLSAQAGASPDLVLVVLGVNDTTGLTPRGHWRRRLHTLIMAIRQQHSCPILFTSVPRMDSFTALPQPLRTVIGWRGRLLDHDLRGMANAHPGVCRAPALPLLNAQQLSADGYHPSALACLDWAAQLAECLPVLRPQDTEAT